ncbi:MAG: AraC family transcriptional regulator [Gemmatimonadaceae bacterium]|nr:AraC family transcriptional regulator [Gemmatimonadaceae bacterium]
MATRPAHPTKERLFLRLDGDPLCAPETTVPASTLRAFAVPAALRPLVAHVTAYEEHFADGHETVERVLPDGASRLIVALNGGNAEVQVAGASASPVVLAMRGHMHGISLTLRPGASLALFGVPASELANQTVPWDALARGTPRQLPGTLVDAGSDARRVEQLFVALGTMRRPTDLRMQRAIGSVAYTTAVGASSLSTRNLAAELGLSARRVQQLFASHLGLTPGVWRRLQRMHGVLRRLRANESPRHTPKWTQLALDAGYYDQAHLVNEFRELAGLTPGELLRSVSHSSNTPAGARDSLR